MVYHKVAGLIACARHGDLPRVRVPNALVHEHRVISANWTREPAQSSLGRQSASAKLGSRTRDLRGPRPAWRSRDGVSSAWPSLDRIGRGSLQPMAGQVSLAGTREGQTTGEIKEVRLLARWRHVAWIHGRVSCLHEPRRDHRGARGESERYSRGTDKRNHPLRAENRRVGGAVTRRDLIRRLADTGCVFIRHGARHDW